MKNLSFKTTLILLLVYSNTYSQLYKSFQTQYKIGISLEFLGTSPSGSANIELMAFKWPKSFINMQVGVGIISTPTGIWSFPQVITYNYWLNQRNNTRKKDCKPEKKEKKAEYFIEVGVCNLIIAGQSGGKQIDYIFPVAGLRVHFPFNHKSAFFAKLMYIPFTKYVHQTEFGIAIGTSL